MSHEDESIPIKDACYYLTLNITDWTDIFVKPVFKQIIAESLNYFVAKKGLTVYGWCLMTNHLHLIARVGNGQSLSDVAQDFKQFTTKIILEDLEAESETRRNWILKRFRDAGRGFGLQQRFKVWQEKIHPVFIDCDDAAVMHEHLEYIHSHPVRERIVSDAEEYLYSSARDYAGRKGLVNIVQMEEPARDFRIRYIS